MSFRPIVFLLSALLVIGAQKPTYGNTRITAPLSGPTKRIIALSPAITEIIFDLGAEKNLVGVSEFSDFPEAAKKFPNVGPYTKPTLEKIIGLKPDLVFLPQEGPQDVQTQFDRLKIKYEVIKMRTLEDIPKAALQIAKALELHSAGEKFSARWGKMAQEIFSDERSRKMPLHPKIFIEVQFEPLYVAGQDTFLDQIVNRCGAVNIFGNLKGYPRVAREKVFAQPVALILALDHLQSESDRGAILQGWKKFPTTAKAKVIFINPDIASRPGPRLLEGAKEICQAIKGDVASVVTGHVQ